VLQSNIRTATFVILSIALATTAGAQPSKGGFAPPAAPVPHVAPAPHISATPAPHMSVAPAPHIFVAPQISAPRVAPQISAPRVMSVPRVVPQQFAHPEASRGAVTRHVETPRALEAPRQEKHQIGGLGPANLDARQRRELTNRIGRNVTPQNQPNQKWQLTGGNRAASDRVLRNSFFANKPAAGDPAARRLARSTFHGRFFDRDGRHHHRRAIVIGWAGPLFWPYAYDDFVDYTFYPYAYDTFWPYAYDDVYEGIFGRYAYGSGSAYASVQQPRSTGAGGATVRPADLCTSQTAGLTDWPIERIEQVVEPNDEQRAALVEFKDAAARAFDLLKASCPAELPSTPTGRLAAMHQRLDAMLQAVRTVRPALEKFYLLLNDEQKARFNALGPDQIQDQQSRRDLTQVCGERASGIGNLPIAQIERTVQPNEAQRAALKELQDATAQAVDLLKSNCPTYQALTPVVRLEAMEQRLAAMFQAVQTVEPVLEKFYGSLSDEQKERFNRLPPRQA
jgi:ABC-type transporter MlaC component